MDQPQDAAAAEQPGSEKGGSLDGENTWWFSSIAYGIGWDAILMLLLLIPSAKWADVKYAPFDKRPTIGLGSWSACSIMFKEDVAWAKEPLMGLNATTAADKCMSKLVTECNSTSGYSNVKGANSKYESAFNGCKTVSTADCTPRSCCIPVDTLCTDVRGIKAAGGLATTG